MSEARCSCETNPETGARGGDPGRIAGIEIIEDNGRFPAALKVRCRLCGNEWQVFQIPYGGS